MVIIGPERGGQNVCVSGAEMMGDPYGMKILRKKGKRERIKGGKDGKGREKTGFLSKMSYQIISKCHQHLSIKITSSSTKIYT
jgi:hypothetical protein